MLTSPPFLSLLKNQLSEACTVKSYKAFSLWSATEKIAYFERGTLFLWQSLKLSSVRPKVCGGERFFRTNYCDQISCDLSKQLFLLVFSGVRVLTLRETGLFQRIILRHTLIFFLQEPTAGSI